jgi:C1A family cysteine protease
VSKATAKRHRPLASVLGLALLSALLATRPRIAVPGDEPARRHPLGVVADSAESIRAMPEMLEPRIASLGSGDAPTAKAGLPDSMDLSGRFPPPGQQGYTQGSCTAWAVAYGLMGYFEAIHRNWTPAEHPFSASYVYNQIKKTADCGSGSSIIEALDLVCTQGVCLDATFPYDPANCSAIPPQSAREQASLFKATAKERVPLDLGAFRATIAAGSPIVIGMNIGDTFQSLHDASTYDHAPDGDTGAHAMVVVGYDKGRSAFRLVNSWGTNWGDGGFAWVSYNRLTAGDIYVAYRLIPPQEVIKPTLDYTDNEWESQMAALNKFAKDNPAARGYRVWITGLAWDVAGEPMLHYAIAEDPYGWGPYPRDVGDWIRALKAKGLVGKDDVEYGFSNTIAWLNGAYWISKLGGAVNGHPPVGAVPTFVDVYSNNGQKREMGIAVFSDTGTDLRVVPFNDLNVGGTRNRLASSFLWAKGHGYAGGYPTLIDEKSQTISVVCFKAGYLREATVSRKLLTGK